MKKIILNLILLCCFLNAMAQNEVLVSPVINPPYSPYLSDYEEEAIILLQNNTSRNLQIKLSGRLTGDNGFEAFTKPEFQPLSAI